MVGRTIGKAVCGLTALILSAMPVGAFGTSRADLASDHLFEQGIEQTIDEEDGMDLYAIKEDSDIRVDPDLVRRKGDRRPAFKIKISASSYDEIEKVYFRTSIPFLDGHDPNALKAKSDEHKYLEDSNRVLFFSRDQAKFRGSHNYTVNQEFYVALFPIGVDRSDITDNLHDYEIEVVEIISDFNKSTFSETEKTRIRENSDYKLLIDFREADIEDTTNFSIYYNIVEKEEEDVPIPPTEPGFVIAKTAPTGTVSVDTDKVYHFRDEVVANIDVKDINEDISQVTPTIICDSEHLSGTYGQFFGPDEYKPSFSESITMTLPYEIELSNKEIDLPVECYVNLRVGDHSGREFETQSESFILASKDMSDEDAIAAISDGQIPGDGGEEPAPPKENTTPYGTTVSFKNNGKIETAGANLTLMDANSEDKEKNIESLTLYVLKGKGKTEEDINESNYAMDPITLPIAWDQFNEAYSTVETIPTQRLEDGIFTAILEADDGEFKDYSPGTSIFVGEDAIAVAEGSMTVEDLQKPHFSIKPRISEKHITPGLEVDVKFSVRDRDGIAHVYVLNEDDEILTPKEYKQLSADQRPTYLNVLMEARGRKATELDQVMPHKVPLEFGTHELRVLVYDTEGHYSIASREYEIESNKVTEALETIDKVLESGLIAQAAANHMYYDFDEVIISQTGQVAYQGQEGTYVFRGYGEVKKDGKTYTMDNQNDEDFAVAEKIQEKLERALEQFDSLNWNDITYFVAMTPLSPEARRKAFMDGFNDGKPCITYFPDSSIGEFFIEEAKKQGEEINPGDILGVTEHDGEFRYEVHPASE